MLLPRTLAEDGRSSGNVKEPGRRLRYHSVRSGALSNVA